MQSNHEHHAAPAVGAQQAAGQLPAVIWAMVVAAFAMGADEFIVAGVLQEIAEALTVTLGAAGHFESAYALGVAIGAPLFTALGTRVGRRAMLLGTAFVFVAGNALSALGATYEWIMAGRIVAATAHGAFFGIAAVYAAELVEPARKGRAIATLFAGMTAATVLGAPLGAFVGQLFGWRATFWTLVLLGGVAALALLVLLPRRAGRQADAAHDAHSHAAAPTAADVAGLDAHARAHLGGGGHAAPLEEQVRALARPAVWQTLAVTLLGYSGVFTSYTYLAPQLTEVAGYAPAWVTPMFLLLGLGLFAGNYLGGRLADWNAERALLLTIASLVASLLLLGLAITSAVAVPLALFVFGMASFSVVAPLQLRVVTLAGEAPDVASAANISAFTLGSALGIWLGGLAIDGGLGIASVNWVGAAASSAGLVAAFAALRRGRAAAASPRSLAHAMHEHHQHHA